MARHLAAEGGALVAHPGLEERVADAVHVRLAARLRHQVAHGARGAHVVEDRGAGLLLQHRLGQQGGQEVAVHERAGVVDEEAAVGVAVPGDPQVGPLGQHLVDDEPAVLLQQRVGLVVGELAVGLPVGLHLLDRQPVEDRAAHGAGHAVAAVEHHPHGAHRRGVDERERVGAEGLGHVLAGDLAGGLGGRPGVAVGHDLGAARRCPRRRRAPARRGRPAWPPCRPWGCARRCT